MKFKLNYVYDSESIWTRSLLNIYSDLDQILMLFLDHNDTNYIPNVKLVITFCLIRLTGFNLTLSF